jgi:AcrR family transcriptional regulator
MATNLPYTLSTVKAICIDGGIVYTEPVPKLWDETIDTHRRAVREAILDTTAALAAAHGPLSVTMSQIAEETGIGRATLYKYFPDVEAILTAWHERQIAAHLQHLAEIRDHANGTGRRLEAVLNAYALIRNEHHDAELATLLHRGEHIARAEQHLRDFLQDLLTEAAEKGEVRDDVAPGELASYCLHALTAASTMPSKAAVLRLVNVTLAGLRPPEDSQQRHR